MRQCGLFCYFAEMLPCVRTAIQQKLTGRRPAIKDIADALHVSSRTLQRRLQDEGSRFPSVLQEEARHQLARHYLNNPVLELNEAAKPPQVMRRRTLSSSLSAFGKAFRRLAGVKNVFQGSIVTGPVNRVI